MLLGVVYYAYGVTGMILFSKNDPFHFSTIPVACMTMFRCSTLDNWVDVMNINMYGCANEGVDSTTWLYKNVSGQPGMMVGQMYDFCQPAEPQPRSAKLALTKPTLALPALLPSCISASSTLAHRSAAQPCLM